MRSGRLRRAAATLGMAGCVLATVAATPTAAAQKHFLWKATGSKGVAYLLGTMHFGKPELYPLPAVIEDGFRASDTLVEEIDLSGGGELKGLARDAAARGTYKAGDTIASHIGNQTLEMLTKFAQNHPLGANYQRLKPWLLSLVIDQQEARILGLDLDKGLDKHFLQEAIAAHKPVVGLETGDFQLQMLMSFSDDMQDRLLLTSLLEAQHEAELVDKIVAAWKNGDPDAMERVITEEVRRYPVVQPYLEKTLYERNATMANKIDGLLQSGKAYFVAVGAAHLVGARGILSLLQAKGYTIEQQ